MSHITKIDGTIFIPKNQLCHLLEAVQTFCPDCELVQGQSHYRTWKDDHNGKLVGDWPLPDGWTADQIGEGAHHVIRVTDKALKEKFKCGNRSDNRAPYEIGVVPVSVKRDKEGNVLSAVYDPKGTEYTLMTDWWQNGQGLLNLPGIGGRTNGINPQTNKKTEISFGDLYMHYRMMQAKAEAERQGDTISFVKQKDGSYVGQVETQARLGC